MRSDILKRRVRGRALAGAAVSALSIALTGGLAYVATVQTAIADTYTSVDLSGKVVDQSGKPIGNAEVTVSSKQGQVYKTKTDAQGNFRVSGVPVGDYKVAVAAAGFDSANVDVRAEPGSSSYEVALNSSSVSEKVVVKARRVKDFNRTDTGNVTNVVEEAKKIPLGRSINSVVSLAPSVGQADPSIVANGVRRAQSGVVVSGTSAAESVYYINGLNVTDQRTFLGYSDLPFDFLQTIESKTGGYQAEYGRATGGVVNILTRSGDNDFHYGLSAYWTPNALRETRPLSHAPGGNNSVGQQVYNEFAKADSNEQVLWASGALVKDHIFFFGIYNPRSNDAWGGQGFTNTTTANGTWTNTSSNDARWGAKVDFVINDDHRIEATWFSDAATIDNKPWNVSRATNNITPTSASRPDGSLLESYNQTGGQDRILKYTGRFNDWFSFSALYGRIESSYKDTGPAITTPGILDFAALGGGNVTIGRQAGPFNVVGSDVRDTYRADADFFVNWYGDHHFRVGYDLEDMTSTALSQYSGGGLMFAFAQADCPAGTGIEGCLEITRFSNVGDFRAQQSAAYVQDSWRMSDNFTLNLGLRLDIYDYKNRANVSYYKEDGQLAPRVGFSWDPIGKGTDRVSGSYGQFFLPVALNTSIRAVSGEVFTDSFYQLDRSGTSCTTSADPLCGVVTVDANGQPTGVGALVVPTTFLSPAGAPDPRAVLAKDLEPMYEEAFTLGYEKDMTSGWLDGWTFGLNATYRNLKKTIEDTQIGDAVIRYCQRLAIAPCNTFTPDDAGGFYPFVLVNPGSEVGVLIDFEGDLPFLGDGVTPNPAYNPHDIVLTPSDMALNKAKREYKALEFTFKRPFDGVWGLQGSYTLSKSVGNYEGAVKSDIGQTDTSITQDFDHSINGVGSYGNLPNDRRHRIKVWGNYQLFEGFNIGVNQTAESGRPVGCFGYTPRTTDPFAPNSGTPSTWSCPNGTLIGAIGGSLASQLGAVGAPANNYNSVLVGRGAVGTTPWIYQTDLSISYRFADTDLGGATAMMDVFNVFDDDEVIRVVEQGEVRTSASGTKGVRAPFYGMPRTYQTPRTVRLGLKWEY